MITIRTTHPKLTDGSQVHNVYIEDDAIDMGIELTANTQRDATELVAGLDRLIAKYTGEETVTLDGGM